MRGEARFLPVPGIIDSARAAKVLLQDSNVSNTLALFEEVTLALVGVGTLEPSSLVASSGNIFLKRGIGIASKSRAVEDICLRFYDSKGRAIRGSLNDRVIGMTLDGLRQVRRSVAICGGKEKFPAILGAVRGQWINTLTLVTDQHTAQRLAKAQTGKGTAA